MSMFDPATPETESPDTGHEEATAAETETEQYEEQETNEETVVEEEEAEQEQTDPDEGHSEQLLAGKYKSPSELEKAYVELQKQFTRQRMEDSQKAAQQQPQPIQPQDGVDFNDPDSIIAAINRDPMGTIAQIAQQSYQQARSAETQEQQYVRGIEEIAETYKDQMQTKEDVDTYWSKVHEVCRELGVNPRLPSPRILKMASQELWGDPQAKTTTQVYKQAIAAARAESEKTRQAKVGLSAPVGRKPQETPKTEADLIRESIVAASRSGGMFS